MLLSLLTHLLIPTSSACGAFFGPEDVSIFSDAQEVLFEQEDGQTMVVLSLTH